MFDYSVCDFCPFDVEYDSYCGNVCENCQAKAAERRLCQLMADLDDEDRY